MRRQRFFVILGSHLHFTYPGRLKPAVTLPISELEISLAWPSAWFAAVRIMSSSKLRVGRIQRLRIDFDGGNGAVAFRDDLDRAAAAGGLDRARGELGLDLFHLLLHARSLFHEFADAGHKIGIWELGFRVG